MDVDDTRRCSGTMSVLGSTDESQDGRMQLCGSNISRDCEDGGASSTSYVAQHQGILEAADGHDPVSIPVLGNTGKSQNETDLLQIYYDDTVSGASGHNDGVASVSDAVLEQGVSVGHSYRSSTAEGSSGSHFNDIDVEENQVMDIPAIIAVGESATNHCRGSGQASRLPDYRKSISSQSVCSTEDSGEFITEKYPCRDQKVIDCNNNFGNGEEEMGSIGSPKHAVPIIDAEQVDLDLQNAIGLALTGGSASDAAAMKMRRIDTATWDMDRIEREEFSPRVSRQCGANVTANNTWESQDLESDCEMNVMVVPPSTATAVTHVSGIEPYTIDMSQSSMNVRDFPTKGMSSFEGVNFWEPLGDQLEDCDQLPTKMIASGMKTEPVSAPFSGENLKGAHCTGTGTCDGVVRSTAMLAQSLAANEEDPSKQNQGGEKDLDGDMKEESAGMEHSLSCYLSQEGSFIGATGMEQSDQGVLHGIANGVDIKTPIDEVHFGSEWHMIDDAPQSKRGTAVSIKTEPMNESHVGSKVHFSDFTKSVNDTSVNSNAEPMDDSGMYLNDIPQSKHYTAVVIKAESMNDVHQGTELSLTDAPQSKHGTAVGIKVEQINELHHDDEWYMNDDAPQSERGTAVSVKMEPMNKFHVGSKVPLSGVPQSKHGTAAAIKEEPMNGIHQQPQRDDAQSKHGSAVGVKTEQQDDDEDDVPLDERMRWLKNRATSITTSSVITRGEVFTPHSKPMNEFHVGSEVHLGDVSQSKRSPAAAIKEEPINGIHQQPQRDDAQSKHGTAVGVKTEQQGEEDDEDDVPLDERMRRLKNRATSITTSSVITGGEVFTHHLVPMNEFHVGREMHHSDVSQSKHSPAVGIKEEPMNGIHQQPQRDDAQSKHGTAVGVKTEQQGEEDDEDDVPLDERMRRLKNRATSITTSSVITGGEVFTHHLVPMNEFHVGREMHHSDVSQSKHSPAVGIKEEPMNGIHQQPQRDDAQSKHGAAVGVKTGQQDDDEDDVPLDERMRWLKNRATSITTSSVITRGEVFTHHSKPMNEFHVGREMHLSDVSQSKHSPAISIKEEPMNGIHQQPQRDDAQSKHGTAVGVKTEQQDDDEDDVPLDERMRGLKNRAMSITTSSVITRGFPEITITFEDSSVTSSSNIKEKTDISSTNVKPVLQPTKTPMSADRVVTSGHSSNNIIKVEVAAGSRDPAGDPEDAISIKEECHGEKVKLVKKEFKCEQCNKSFATSKNLQCHSYCHTDRYKCEICGRRCVSPSALEHHQRMHSGERPHVCKYCPKSFSHPSNLLRHERVHRGEKTHRCTYCERAFVTKPELTMHERAKHTGRKPHRCGECGKTFICASRMRLHQRVHSGIKPYSCEVCHGRFASLAMLGIHIRTHTGSCLQCRYCSKSFWYESSRRRHEKMHRSTLPHQCKFCGKGFLEKNNLRVHERVHTGARPFSCTQCDKSFRCAATLKNHGKMHKPKERLECGKCGKAYTSLRSLNDHQRTHTGDLLYCEDCGKSFTAPSKLQRHMEVHLEERERPHQCEECERSFHTRGNLLKHQVSHSEEKNHRCKVCNKGFKLPGALQTHQIVHTGEQPFECSFCGRLFNKQNNMRIHELKIHSAARQAHEPRTPYSDVGRHFRCRFCGGLYGSKGSKTLHERTVHSAV